MLPVSVGIDLDVLYPSSADVRGNPSLPKIEVNHFVDAILHAVYRAGTQNRQQSRKILFSSRSPTVIRKTPSASPRSGAVMTSTSA